LNERANSTGCGVAQPPRRQYGVREHPKIRPTAEMHRDPATIHVPPSCVG
jgi:hypothetical protein